MNFKSLIAAAFVATLSLTGCGGGGSAPDPWAGKVYSGNPASLKTTDTTAGTGTQATAASTVEVKYTGWLYNDKAADLKGTQFDTGALTGANAVPLNGTGGYITGFVQGIIGMKVGGKRTILIPSSQGYGAEGRAGAIPPNAGLVFEVELTAVK